MPLTVGRSGGFGQDGRSKAYTTATGFKQSVAAGPSFSFTSNSFAASIAALGYPSKMIALVYGDNAAARNATNVTITPTSGSVRTMTEVATTGSSTPFLGWYICDYVDPADTCEIGVTFDGTMSRVGVNFYPAWNVLSDAALGTFVGTSGDPTQSTIATALNSFTLMAAVNRSAAISGTGFLWTNTPLTIGYNSDTINTYVLFARVSYDEDYFTALNGPTSVVGFDWNVAPTNPRVVAATMR